MDNSWLNIIARDHNKWVAIVKSFGEDFYSDDIVQEMYIKVLRYAQPENIIKDDKVNSAYIFFVLKNIFLDYVKTKNRIEKIRITDEIQLKDESANPYQVLADHALNIKIENEINSWHQYDSMLFRLYIESDKSMRELASGTKISLSSIFNTIKLCKERLRLAVGEDFEDYINNDFELI